jgi:hypothetical protein
MFLKNHLALVALAVRLAPAVPEALLVLAALAAQFALVGLEYLKFQMYLSSH